MKTEVQKVDNDKVIKENFRLMKAIDDNLKKGRQVEEESEPVLKDIIIEFNVHYGKTVAAKSVAEVLKFLKDEKF